MRQGMRQALLDGCSEQSTQRTQQTQRTQRIQDTSRMGSVSYPRTPVDNDVLGYVPDVVDANSEAWDAFIASVDPVTVELERVVAPRRAAAVVEGERFGGAGHRLMLEDHERSRVRFAQAVAASFEPVSPVPNRYRVRRGEFWMPVGRRNAERFVVEVIEVSRGFAVTYRRGYLRKLPLDMFHGQRGGFMRVDVDDVTRATIRAAYGVADVRSAVREDAR